MNLSTFFILLSVTTVVSSITLREAFFTLKATQKRIGWRDTEFRPTEHMRGEDGWDKQLQNVEYDVLKDENGGKYFVQKSINRRLSGFFNGFSRGQLSRMKQSYWNRRR